jgi:predicted ATP-dependent endonuclease of OLD family
MAQRDYSEHQIDIISRYYSQLDTIMLYKLQAMVSELYVADSDAKRDRLWQRVHKAMIKLNVPQPIIDHIMSKKDVEVLAKNLQEWLAHAGGKR